MAGSVRSYPSPARTRKNADLTTPDSVDEMGKSLPLWRLQGQEISDTDRAYIGMEFAHVITQLAKGRYVDPKSMEPKAKPFKQVFWDDPLYNPPLRNTHICYEYDAQINEAESYWRRGGKKFSDEPRLAKLPNGDPNERGPQKPEEFPNCFEKSHHVFDRKVELRPFSRARAYNKPVERRIHGNSSSSSKNTVNPLTYKLPDPWGKYATNHAKSPTPQFKSGVGRFASDVSPVYKKVQEASLAAETVPSIDTRPYTPFPALDYMTGDHYTQEETADDVYYEGLVQRGKATTLGGALLPLFPGGSVPPPIPLTPPTATEKRHTIASPTTGGRAAIAVAIQSSSSQAHSNTHAHAHLHSHTSYGSPNSHTSAHSTTNPYRSTHHTSSSARPHTVNSQTGHSGHSQTGSSSFSGKRTLRTPKPIPIRTADLPDSPTLFASTWDHAFSLSKSPLVSTWGKLDDFDLKYRRLRKQDGTCIIVPVTSDLPLHETLNEMPGAFLSKNWNQVDETHGDGGIDHRIMKAKPLGPFTANMPRSAAQALIAYNDSFTTAGNSMRSSSNSYSSSSNERALTVPPIRVPMSPKELPSSDYDHPKKFDDEDDASANSKDVYPPPLPILLEDSEFRTSLHDPYWKSKGASSSTHSLSLPHGLQSDSAFAKAIVDNWVPPTQYSAAPVVLIDQSNPRAALNVDSLIVPSFGAFITEEEVGPDLGLYARGSKLGADGEPELAMMPMYKSRSQKNQLKFDQRDQRESVGRESPTFSPIRAKRSEQGRKGEKLDPFGKQAMKGISKSDMAAASQVSELILRRSSATTMKKYDNQLDETHVTGDDDYAPIDHNFW